MRSMMNFTTALLATVLAASSASAAISHVCLDVRKIDSSVSKDGKILAFKMHDGTVLRNHLKQRCDGLIYSGFTWMVKGGDNRVCEDTQTLKVLLTGEICVLGKFDAPVNPIVRTRK
jgi:hypothetical protein